jgi:hypothetical protein
MSDEAIKSSKHVLGPIDRVSEVLFGLIAESSKSFEQARRYAQLTAFEFEESLGGGRVAVQNTKSTLSHAERVFVPLTSLASDQIWNEWQQLPPAARIVESELRNAITKRVERAAASDEREDAGANLSTAFARWTETMQALQVKNSRVALVSQIAAEVQHLG